MSGADTMFDADLASRRGAQLTKMACWERIEAAIWSASAAGVPGGQARLFDWPAADAKETT